MQVSKIALAIAFYSLGVAAFPMQANCGPTTSRELQNEATSGTEVAVKSGFTPQACNDKLLKCGKCESFTTNSARRYFNHYADCSGKSK